MSRLRARSNAGGKNVVDYLAKFCEPEFIVVYAAGLRKAGLLEQ